MKPLLRSLALLVIATLAALLLGELGLRLADQSYYWAFAKRPDPVLGWRPPAHQAAWQRFEGQARVRTNRLGFRDRDHRRQKPAGVLRVAVLGDSFTEAVQVPIEDTWWRRMANALDARGCAGDDTAVEVMSFAVSGYSTAQALLAWRHHARAFAPDIVILAFFIGNDLTENLHALDDEPLRPYLVPRGDELRLDQGFRTSPDYQAATALSGRLWQWLTEHSRSVQLALQARDAWRVAALARAEAVTGDQPQERGVDNAIYRPPASPSWRQSWRATEAMLAAFAAEVRAADAQPVLMLIGTGAQVHPNAQGRAQFAAALDVPDLGYPVRRLVAAAATQQLPVLNLPALWTRPSLEPPPLRHGLPGARPGFGHWNAQGHAEAGQAAAQLICRLTLSESMR